jgi:hypothetical protein
MYEQEEHILQTMYIVAVYNNVASSALNLMFNFSYSYSH